MVGLGLAVGTANVAQANGCGVPFNAGTYSLSIPAHFAVLGGCDPTASYVLVNDVDLAGITVAKRTNFMGTFDGQGFTIRNMTVTGSAMFDVSVAGATFRRVHFENAMVRSGSGQQSSSAGGLVGDSNGPLTISDSSFRGTVVAENSDNSSTGGLVGRTALGVVANFTNVSSTATVIGGPTESAHAGGILGWSSGTTTFADSSFLGTVSGGSGLSGSAGGFLGFVEDGLVTIIDSYASGSVLGGPGNYASAGGFIGQADGALAEIRRSYFTGQVSGGSGLPAPAGGFIGLSLGNVSVSTSYMTGQLEGGTGTSAAAGGFVGTWCCNGGTFSIQVNDSFARVTATGGPGGASRTGGIVGVRSTNVTTSITNSYGQGTFTSGLGSEAWSFALSRAASPAVSASASFCVTVCESGGSGVGVTVSATNLVAAAQSAGWNFSSTWCVSPSFNDGFPVLKGLTFGPNAAWGSCGAVVAPTPSVVPVWSVSVDLDGGTCRDTSGPLSGAFIGYRYLPGAAECSRPGYVFRGWARASDPNKVIDLPLLVDPSDGVERYFFATGADLVAVWSAAPTPPSAMTPFVAFSNFLCDRCTTLWLIWSGDVERQTATSRVVVTDASDREVCTTGVVDVAPWRVCEITGLTPGSTHTYRIVVSDGGVSSAPVSTQITLNNRRR